MTASDRMQYMRFLKNTLVMDAKMEINYGIMLYNLSPMVI